MAITEAHSAPGTEPSMLRSLAIVTNYFPSSTSLELVFYAETGQVTPLEILRHRIENHGQAPLRPPALPSLFASSIPLNPDSQPRHLGALPRNPAAVVARPFANAPLPPIPSLSMPLPGTREYCPTPTLRCTGPISTCSHYSDVTN